MCGTPQRSRRISTGCLSPASGVVVGSFANTDAASARQRASGLAYILFHPVDMALHDVENEFRLLRPMGRARIGDHFSGHTAPFQRMVILESLADRDAIVCLAMQK